jgi:hypothetical protein
MPIGKDLVDTSVFSAVVHVPQDTERVDGASVEVPFQSLANRTKFLIDEKFSKHGGVIDGATEITDDLDINGGALIVHAGTTVDIASDDVRFESGSIVDFKSGSTVTHASGSESEFETGSELRLFGRIKHRPRVTVADVASVTIDTTQGEEFVLPVNPIAASPNVIVLRTSTAPLPMEDETITLIAHFNAGTGNELYSIRREDAVVICRFRPIGGQHITVTAQFRFTSGVWRLGPNSGTSTWWNTVGPAIEYYGVLPDVGA